MTSEQSKAYNQWIKWLAQVAIKEADTVTERKQVAIEKLSDTAVNLANTVRTALSSGIKLTPDYKETMKKIIAFWKPPETVKYFQEVLANPNNFSV